MLPFPHVKDKALCDLSSFGIGGPARFYAEAKTTEALQEMLIFCFEKKLPFFILGKGSNSLFDDRGFNGLVIANKIDFCKQNGNEFEVGAGYSFARLGSQTARLGFAGLEFAAGIPATVGGAIFMNAGANGKETFETLQTVTFIDERGEKKVFKKQDLKFGYRTSSFQEMKGAIVVATFLLEPSKEAKEHQRKIVDYRLKTQPYKDKSAGCAFRNPPGHIAGKLIEECGWKGKGIGGAEVSTLHANFIINKEGATATDILNLVKEVKERVLNEKGVLLEEEIRYVPYE